MTLTSKGFALVPFSRPHHDKQIAASVAAFKDHVAQLGKRDPQKVQAFCQVDTDTAFSDDDRKRRYACTRCKRVAPLHFYCRLKCPRSPVQIKHMDFLRFSKGLEWTEKHQEANAAGWLRNRTHILKKVKAQRRAQAKAKVLRRPAARKAS